MRLSKFQGLFVIFTVMLLTIVAIEVPNTFATSSTSQDKALSFLGNVIGLDMSKYTSTLTRITSSEGEEDFGCHLDNSLTNHVDASFMFFDGKLGRCNFGQFGGQLLYSQPETDQYNQTFRLIHNYQQWLGDPDVGVMAKLLSRVNSIQNVTEFSGNTTMKIVNYSPTNIFIKFSNTINDVDYTGLQITYGAFGAFFFDDSRAYQTIGNTNINISKEQAIAIAEDYVRYNFSYRNIVQNLNVTGVGTAHLTTRVSTPDNKIDSINKTLSPYWYIQIYVNNLPNNLGGVIVQVSANDGTVVSPTLFSSPPGVTQFLPTTFSLILKEAFALLITATGTALVITGIIFYSRKKRKESQL